MVRRVGVRGCAAGRGPSRLPAVNDMAEASRLVFVYVRGIYGVVVFDLLAQGVAVNQCLSSPLACTSLCD